MIITVAQLEVFMLIIARMAGLFAETPVLGSRLIPFPVKVTLAIWIAVVLWFVVPISGPLPPDLPTFVLAIINEMLIGLVIGFICFVIFSAVQAAGDLIDLQMGLSIATVISPTTGGITSIVGAMAFMLGTTIFIALDGHHLILSSFEQSFRLLPLAAPIKFTSGNLLMQMIEILRTFWLIAIQLSAPIILLIFLSDFAFGIVSRVAPQVNVFMLGFQVKPALGLAGFLLILPLLSRHISDMIAKMGEEILKALMILKP